RGSGLNYFFAYYLDPASVTSFLDTVGLAAAPAGETSAWRSVLGALGLQVRPDYSNAASVGLSFFFVIGSIIQIGGIIASKPLSDRFGKKTIFMIGLVGTTVCTAAVYLLGPSDMNEMFILSVLWAIF